MPHLRPPDVHHGALPIPRPRSARPVRPPLLALTIDVLPEHIPYVITELPGGRVLITVREGITNGEIEQEYLRSLTGRHWELVAEAFAYTDPVAYRPWWNRDERVSFANILAMEEQGLLIPWPHRP